TRRGLRNRRHPLLARARRWARPVRRLPAGVQAARGPARAVLRACTRERCGRADDLRPIERLLRRSDREEAAQPLPPRDARALVRYGRLQPLVSFLPELGHLEVT